MERLTRSFDAFFKGEGKVAVLKGGWGVGKTFFWDAYISNRINHKNLNQIAYSYISLFGKSSLNDVKKSLFHNAIPISSDSKIEMAFDEEFINSSKLLNKVPWVKESISKVHEKAPWFNWLSKNSHHVPILGKFSNIISNLEYGLVKNYVICFDDLERKGRALSVREIMGLIDELALRKDCTVILIFNEDSLESDDDKKEFKTYREKVVDIELSHNPSYIENVRHVFPPEYKHLSTIMEVVCELDIKNIRVLKKVKWLIEDLKENFKGKDNEIFQEFLVHATLLSCRYYADDEVLPFSSLKEQLNENSWVSFLGEEDDDGSESELRYRSISSNLKLSPSNFDKHIIYHLENGFFDKDALIKVVNELSEKIKSNQVSTSLRAAWDIYSGSFSDNQNEFIAAIRTVIDENIERIGLPDFSSAIDVLEEFGEDVSTYIENYMAIHKNSLKNINLRDSWDMERVKSTTLRELIEKLHDENINYNIDDVAEKISVNRGWSPEDIGFLASLTKEDFYDWMKSNPHNLTKKIRNGLLILGGMSTSGIHDKDKYEEINKNVINALKDIASENEFNRKRIKNIYELEF